MRRRPARRSRSVVRVFVIAAVVVLLGLAGVAVALSARTGATKRFAAPGAPTNLRVTPTTPVPAFKLTWTRPTDGDIDHYLVLANGSVLNPNVPGTTFIDNTIALGESRTYMVEAVAPGGLRSPPAGPYTATAPPPPAKAGTLFSTYFESKGSVSAYWKEPVGFSWVGPTQHPLSGRGSGKLISTSQHSAYALRQLATSSKTLYFSFKYRIQHRGPGVAVPLLRVLDTNAPKRNVLAALFYNAHGTLTVRYPRLSSQANPPTTSRSTGLSPSEKSAWTLHFGIQFHNPTKTSPDNVTYLVSIGNGKPAKIQAHVTHYPVRAFELSAPTKQRSYTLLVDSLIVGTQPLPTPAASSASGSG